MRSAVLVATVFIVAAPSFAGLLPGNKPVFVDITITPGRGEPITLHVPLVAAQAIGEHVPSSGDFRVSWDITADPDPFIGAAWAVQNNLGVPQTFKLSTSIPTVLMPAPNVMGGSISGSVTDVNGGGASLSTNSPNPVYTALINGSSAATLLADPFAVFAGPFLSQPFGPAAFGTPIPSAPAPNVTISSIGIDLEFVLSAGDSAAFTSVFVVEVPEPAALSMLALGSLLVCRRRR